MTKCEIFKTLINILRPANVRLMMEKNVKAAENAIYPKVQEAGLNVLGMGLYAIVVEHKSHPGRVFKVTTSRWDGFREYAKYCIQNQDKDFIPKIHCVKEDGNFGCYELDKYYPIVKPLNGYESFVSIKSEDMYSYAHAGQYGDCIDYLQGTDEQIAIYKTTLEIAKIFGERFVLDIHTGNIMMDKNGAVFITDPLGGNVYREINSIQEDYILN